jgi:hypothetical protein
MAHMNDIQHSTSRIWTSAQLNKTIRDCKFHGFEVINDDEFCIITDIDNDRTVLTAMTRGHNSHIVRINGSYFGWCNYIEPVFIYIDQQNYIVSMTPEDNMNSEVSSLRLFVIERSNIQTFVNYYQLRLHPRTRKAS